MFAELEGRNVVLADGDEYRALLALRDAAANVGAKVEPGVVGTGAGDTPLEAVFPMRVTVLGVDAYVVPSLEYRRLTRPLAPGAAGKRGGRLTRLDKDAELQRFILDRLGTEDVEDIRKAAVERFGAVRVPSRSAVHRFVTRARAEDRRRGGLNER